MKLILVLSLTAACLWSPSAIAADIPMVGLNDEGARVEVLVPSGKYRNNLKKAIVSVESTTLPILQKKSQGVKGWMIRTVVVGLGVATELGLGEVKFGILPRFRVGFSNCKEPSVP